MSIPNDYLERVYAGVLGKMVGVYLGRPFEGWTYQRIMRELGTIEYFVNERLNHPLVVTDDDLSGTFTFVRALEDYGISEDLRAEDVGRAWLNYIVEERSILWWGGRGNSTEHTAWLNLKSGIPAPASGSIATNGRTVAEQIGAQIFIDGWAMVSPGRPELAAHLAEQASTVSHDGEAVYAAKLWAAMEAEAFRSSDIEHLIDVGLSLIPGDCLIARLIADIRSWRRQFGDWRDTRQKIEDTYGYDKYPGNCHVVPNHALMVMAVLYAPHDFQKAQTIVTTSGWDTDCNAGNVGCLLGIMNGLEGLDAGPDWRGPIADRLPISSADGGNSTNDAVREAYHLANLGLQLAGSAPLIAPKGGARFHFSLPGSVQGFRPQPGLPHGPILRVSNTEFEGGRALAVEYEALARGQVGAVTTPTFSSPEILGMRNYEQMATPLIYPGQNLHARIVSPARNRGDVLVGLRLRTYDGDDKIQVVDSLLDKLAPGSETTLVWTIPDLGGQPIAEVGIAFVAKGQRADGTLLVDRLSWNGAPALTLRRPKGSGDLWRMAWVNGVHHFSRYFPPSFRISQNRGEGLIAHGTRQWTDYSATAEIMMHLGEHGGVALRVQGLRRFYGVRLLRPNKLQLVRVRDEHVEVLSEMPLEWTYEESIPVVAQVRGRRIEATVKGATIAAEDNSDAALLDGAVGLFVHEGALSTNELTIGS